MNTTTKQTPPLVAIRVVNVTYFYTTYPAAWYRPTEKTK